MILYTPFAFFAVITTRRPLASILAVSCIAFALELLQNIMDIGVCEEADIVRNIFGVGLGVALGAGASMVYDRARQWRTVTTRD
jgi:glycopeptide antibiotics resistance protein